MLYRGMVSKGATCFKCFTHLYTWAERGEFMLGVTLRWTNIPSRGGVGVGGGEGRGGEGRGGEE